MVSDRQNLPFIVKIGGNEPSIQLSSLHDDI